MDDVPFVYLLFARIKSFRLGGHGGSGHANSISVHFSASSTRGNRVVPRLAALFTFGRARQREEESKKRGAAHSPLSSPFSTASSRAWASEVAGCSRRSPLRCAASSTAGARRRVPAAVARTVHLAAVTCSRGSGPG